jgi:tyrosinase
MTRTRKDIYKLGTPWNDTLLWYAKAVDLLQKRDIAVKTSWRYLAAMHGIDPPLWKQYDYLDSSDKLPSKAEQATYWRQCQHGTWYFLPWHRPYLWSFEMIVLDAVKSLGGPSDWALPYWNYSDTTNRDALKIPPAFLEKYLPGGGRKRNALYVEQRFGSGADADHVTLEDLLNGNFTGDDQGPDQGVGGPQTSFNHAAQRAPGWLEQKPHNYVHGDVGGRDQAGVGLMSDPDTAALDPIFWVHHANIDRLWDVWLARDAANKNPADANWLNGPSNRHFSIFGADGKDVPCRPKDVVKTTALGYVYEDVSDPLRGQSRRVKRLQAFAVEAEKPAEGPEVPPRQGQKAELLGGGGRNLKLGVKAANTEVKLATKPAARLKASFTGEAMSAATPGEPDRVFLSLENIRGNNDAANFDVYLGPTQAHANAPEAHVGDFSLFGLSSASDPKGAHGGRGLNQVIEITKAVDAMHLRDQLDAGTLQVRIVPRKNVRDKDKITIGQINLYRQAAS